MRLSEQGLQEERAQWEAAGYHLPQYEHKEMVERTKENPFWLHFGAGNIFRAFQANVVETLLNENKLDRGLIAIGNHESMEKLSRPHDDYSILVTLKGDGTIEKTVVGSVAEFLTLDKGYEKEFDRLKEIMEKDSLQMVSFTITEKGYSLRKADGSYIEEVQKDLENGPEHPCSYMGKITALLYARYLAGQKPLAMVSMDNCSHNGDKLKAAISVFAETWCELGLTESGFASYVSDSGRVSFPWTMIDKITPRPDSNVEKILDKDDIQDLEPIITDRKTYIAPFVNAEESQYLVMEDCFPNGRPALEQGGLIFTDRETVEKTEKMKVCTCLNPIHTALAVFGCLLDFEFIWEEAKDETLRKLAEKIGYDEGLPVVADPGVIDPKEFIDTVLNVRIPNPFMPDTPQRIATDTSQKLAIRFGETIKAYQAAEDLDVKSLKMIPLVFAGWLRYLMAVDDNGKTFALSVDPLLDSLCPYLSGLELKEDQDIAGAVESILHMKQIFGVDLYEAGLADLVIQYLKEMTSGVGAVRATLERTRDGFMSGF